MSDPGDVPARRDHLRAADADRERVVERLRVAHAEGRLDIHEFDERVAAAWKAQTYGDLAPLTADLPPEQVSVATPATATGVDRASEPRTSVSRASVLAWLWVSLLNVGIWAIVSGTAGEVIYPWWVWIAGPWGVGLLVQWLAERTRRR